jgi:hypothetical protein
MNKQFLTGLLTAAVIASATSAAADDQAPKLTVRARALTADGGPGSSTASPHPMVIGEGVTSYLFAADSLCGVGGAEVTAQHLEDLLRRKMHVWKVTRTGVSHANGKVTFDLEWSRFDKGSGVPSASGRQRLTLGEGAAYPFDMLRAPSECNVSAIVLEVEAGTIESSAFADEMLYYDLWLKYDDGSGKKETRHFVASGKHGALVPFEFTPLRFDTPTLTANQYDLDVVTRVLGHVRGRMLDEKRVSIELETSRSDRIERPEDPKSGPARETGRKRIDVDVNQTVEIEFPPVTGQAAHVATANTKGISGRISAGPATTQPAAPAVTLKDGMVIVSFREFFADDRLSVLIRVRKEP